MKRKSLLVVGALMSSGVLWVLAAKPTHALTCPSDTPNAGATVESLSACSLTHQGNDLVPTVNVIINVITSIVGIVAVIVIILGAIQYVTSGGDAAKLKKAKDAILYGVIGLILSLLAFAIVNFVLGAVGPSIQPGEGGDSGGTPGDTSGVDYGDTGLEEPNAPEVGNPPTGSEYWIDEIN